MTTGTAEGSPNPRTNASVSRPAVPLPMATASTAKSATRAATRVARFAPQALRLVRLDGLVVQQSALGVEDHRLAAGAEARVDGQHDLRAERRREQQIAQVGSEDPDRLAVGPHGEFGARFGLDGGLEQAPVAVVDGRPHLVALGAPGPDEACLEGRERLVLGDGDVHPQKALGLAAEHGQHTVGGRVGRRLLPVEVVAVLGALGLLAAGHLAAERAPVREEGAQLAPGRRRLR